MRIIKANKIKKIVADLCIRANLFLRKDILAALKSAYRKEKNLSARDVLRAIIENAAVAKNERLAVCQDTGMPVVFVEIGQEARIKGDLRTAINKGVGCGYRQGFLRASVVKDPLSRDSSGYFPAIIHLDLTGGSKLKITVLPKGSGCENKTRLKMFKPTAKPEEIKKFIVDAVKAAGPDACPPYVVGVGIGGTADYACLLAKRALLKKVKGQSSKLKAQSSRVKGWVLKLEQDLLKEINRLKIGPMGLGGKTTVLAVNIETFPTHIVNLPVAVNISCHALRSASAVI